MNGSTARVLALLEILQGGGVRTVGDLARRLAVDERTLRRSVSHLVELGIPVESIRGRYGGYRLAPGYRMPPLILTDDEALAVLLGLVGAQRAETFRTTAAASESAAAKIRRVLPDAVKVRLNAVLETTAFEPGGRLPADTEASVLLDIAQAAKQQHPIDIEYTDRAGERTERTLHPYGVVARSGRWYVSALDVGADAMRTFRLDRIISVTHLTGTFDVPAGFDSAAAVLDSLENTPWAHAVSLRIRNSTNNVRRHFPVGIAVVTEMPDAQWLRVELRAERLHWIPPLLAALDCPFVIDRPTELRDLVRALADRLVLDASARS